MRYAMPKGGNDLMKKSVVVFAIVILCSAGMAARQESIKFGVFGPMTGPARLTLLFFAFAG